MRENTRCDVDEPMSTPTLSTTISSSSTSERPVLEKNTRPPTASSVIRLMLLKALLQKSVKAAATSVMPGLDPGIHAASRHVERLSARVYAPTNFGTTVPFL